MTDILQMIAEQLKTLDRRVRKIETKEYTTGGGGGSGTDPDAIHDNVAGEIAAVTQKATPAANDLALIEDSAAGNAKKRATLTSILSAVGAALFAPAAQGVTNGNSHDHVGGDGNQIDHTGLSNLNSANYTHLTAVNHTDLTDGGETTLHKHAGAGYYPLDTPIDLTDSAAHSWAPYAAPVGTYTFRPQDNSNAWPSTAKALHLLILGRWAAASNTSILSLRKTSTGTNHIQLRAVSATVGLNVNGNVSVDSNGYCYAVVEGADLAVGVVRLLGYFL